MQSPGKRRVEVTVIGCGEVSQTAYLPLLTNSPQTTVVAVCGRRPERARGCAAKFGVKAYFTDVERCLREQPSQLVVNLTPPAQHAAVTMSALRAGRHVYSEKPLAVGSTEALEIMTLARSAGLQVAAAPYVRDSPVVRALHEVAASGEVGLVHSVIARYGASSDRSLDWHAWRSKLSKGNVLFRAAVYPIALLLAILGEPRRLTACCTDLWTRLVPKPEFHASAPIAPDNCTVILDFDQGTTAVVQSGFWYGADGLVLRVEMLGDKGAVQIANGQADLMADSIDVCSPATHGIWLHRRFPLGGYHWAGGPLALARELQAGITGQANLSAAIRVLRVLLAAEEASASGTWVDLSEDL